MTWQRRSETGMVWTAEQWPIGAALIQFPARTREGIPVEDAGPAEWARVFGEVTACGFDHVDLTDTWLRPGDLTDGQREDLVRTLKDADLGVTAISVIRRSLLDPEHGKANVDYALRTVEAAAAIGTGVVSLGLHRPLTAQQLAAEWFWTQPGAVDQQRDEASFDLAVARFSRIGRHAASLGIQLSLEMYEDTLLGTAEDAVALVKAIDLPNVGLNPDIGNLIRLHRPIDDWEQMHLKTLPYANYWHVKNYYRDHDPATGAYFTVPAPAESGLISYRRAIEIALDAGFQGPISVEHYGGDGLSVSARNRDYLRGVFRAKLGARR
ncbi:sugar phosphate isomerase/epimerase family protein [Micromonospora soli]|uniref:sugar phosphate isomerase/epimerase family protein n=1 Tax=Micromonospora sp. NBRC 110009 TaxID=3061627 RepID=UPI00267215BB|nr:sugar phosphate isomerase/epimerase family protein [Micromonospora sp. NBRC 110009]WKT98457.1 sugar phosphate isomerase/epimerase family protein [Micromonospora sp. NBRC 110009]